MSTPFNQIGIDHLILLSSLALSAERGEPIGDLPQAIANSCAKKMYDAGASDGDVYQHFGAHIKAYLEKTSESKKRYRFVFETAYFHILMCTRYKHSEQSTANGR